MIRENNCTGTGRDWTQMNQLSGAKSAAQIGVTPDWWPYLKYYCEEAPEIVGYKFKYVGWGIFNDFEGSGVELPHAWKFDEPQEFIISFDLPDGVQNIGNTSVIVMIIDKESNEIIAADVMNADNYSSVERVENSFEYSAIQQNNALTINAECGAKVELFDVKGICLGSYFMTSNMLCIDNLSSKGVILVRITKEHKTAIRKLIWKD